MSPPLAQAPEIQDVSGCLLTALHNLSHALNPGLQCRPVHPPGAGLLLIPLPEAGRAGEGLTRAPLALENDLDLWKFCSANHWASPSNLSTFLEVPAPVDMGNSGFRPGDLGLRTRNTGICIPRARFIYSSLLSSQQANEKSENEHSWFSRGLSSL